MHEKNSMLINFEIEINNPGTSKQINQTSFIKTKIKMINIIGTFPKNINKK
jgi:hypothetical protein